MALVLADRVKETTTTAGTGTVTLLGAAPGFQSFAVVGNANTTYYTIAGQTTSEWEVGIGTYTASGTLLARTTVLSNSSGTQPSALSFAAGTKDVFITYPSERAIYGDINGSITPVDNALVRFDGTAGNIIQTSLVTVADDGAITAPQVASMIPFYYANQAAFPSASTSHGAVAHSHADGAMFFAHGGSWVRILDTGGPLGTPASGTATNLTGTASGLTAGNVTTNANLTGDVTSVGNATSIASGVIVNDDINASAGIVDTKLATISTASKVSNSATTATSANTANAIVARDASGNFTAGTVTAALSGNATTATTLATGRTIAITGDLAYTSGSFDGSAAVTGTGTLATVNSNVGSFTSASITVNAKGLITAASSGAGATPGGSNTQVQYNNAGAFAGSSNLTFNGTNLTCGGTVTANSDERLKTNWRDLPENFIDRLAGVKHGIYDRTDIELTQVGVSAQSLQELLEQAVLMGEDGKLSVAYGNAALVACIQLAQRVVALEQTVAKLTKGI